MKSSFLFLLVVLLLLLLLVVLPQVFVFFSFLLPVCGFSLIALYDLTVADRIFAALEERGINVQYSYCFAANGKAVDALKAPEEAIAALSAAGYSVLHQADLA